MGKIINLQLELQISIQLTLEQHKGESKNNLQLALHIPGSSASVDSLNHVTYSTVVFTIEKYPCTGDNSNLSAVPIIVMNR